jgi:hypothetical protein
MKAIRVLALFVLCASCSMSDEYVDADRATYDVINPAHRAYVQADPLLSDAQKLRRVNLLKTWDMRITAAEGAK